MTKTANTVTIISTIDWHNPSANFVNIQIILRYDEKFCSLVVTVTYLLFAAPMPHLWRSCYLRIWMRALVSLRQNILSFFASHVTFNSRIWWWASDCYPEVSYLFIRSLSVLWLTDTRRFMLGMKYRANFLDSSTKFGTKLRWERLSKYYQRGFDIVAPLQLRVHGHGSLSKC